MASFYYGTDSYNERKERWKDHLHNSFSTFIDNDTQEVDDDNNSPIDFQEFLTEDYELLIQQADPEQTSLIEENLAIACYSIEYGIKRLNLVIERTNDILVNGFDTINAKLLLMIEEQRLGNVLLDNIAQLLRIPDVQKERQYLLENGIKFLKNAVYDNDLFEHALDNLLKAKSIESTDYFTLHRIGQIYLFSPDHIDFKLAEKHFRQAYKFAIVETRENAVQTKNYLDSNLDDRKDLKKQVGQIPGILHQAVECLIYASIASYLQGNFAQAVLDMEQVDELTPNRGEIQFLLAKYLAAAGEKHQILVHIVNAIYENTSYAIKVATDCDLAHLPETRNALQKIRDSQHEQAKEWKDKYLPYMISDSEAKDLLYDGQRLLDTNDVIGAFKYTEMTGMFFNVPLSKGFKWNKYENKWIFEVVDNPPIPILPLGGFILLENLFAEKVTIIEDQTHLLREVIDQKEALKKAEEMKRFWIEDAKEDKERSLTVAGINAAGLFLAPLSIGWFFDNINIGFKAGIVLMLLFVIYFIRKQVQGPKIKEEIQKIDKQIEDIGKNIKALDKEAISKLDLFYKDTKAEQLLFDTKEFHYIFLNYWQKHS